MYSEDILYFFFPLVKTVKQLGFYDESCFILPFTECSRLFFFSLCKLNSACSWFFGLLKRDITGQPDGK